MTNIDIIPEAVERLIASFEEFCLNEGIRLECVSQERATLRALSAALTQSRAETAAAYERAAEEIDCCGCNGDCPMPSTCCAIDAKNIRALATPDQTAALDKLIAEAESLAVEKTAAMVRTWRNTTPMTGEECANAILATIGEKK